MNTVNSRSIAEHLSMLASLLEAEAIRVSTLGLKTHRNLAREAMDVRQMANQLWDADISIALDHTPQKADQNINATHNVAASAAELRLCANGAFPMQ